MPDPIEAQGGPEKYFSIACAGRAEYKGGMLHVTWTAPCGAILRVGELWRSWSGFGFTYVGDVEAARQRGFTGLPDVRVSSPGEIKVRSSVWPTFQNRSMNRRRPERRAWLEALGFGAEEDPDTFDEIARSGGRKVTDRIGVWPHLEVGEEALLLLESGVGELRATEAHVGTRVQGSALQEPGLGIWGQEGFFGILRCAQICTYYEGEIVRVSLDMPTSQRVLVRLRRRE